MQLHLPNTHKPEDKLSVARIDKMRTESYWHDSGPENLRTGHGYFESTPIPQGGANIEFTFHAG